MQKTLKVVRSPNRSENHFSPTYSISSRTRVTDKSLELRLLAGTMEKLRYKMVVKKSKRKTKIPYRILTSEPYVTRTVRDLCFYSGSKYSGLYGPLGSEGYGEFELPDGVIYRGNILSNMFTGEGTLIFPYGGELRAFWIQGVAFNPRYKFADGLQYEHKDWKYCVMPDRRFFSEYENGVKPSGNVQLDNDHPARAIPVGHYDSGEGFYNPYSRELIHPVTGKFIRIPSETERQWILNHCRREWITPLPFDPKLYENWFPQFNKEISKHKRESIWEAIINSIGERTGMEQKIASITGHKPHILHTASNQLFIINDLFNKKYTKGHEN